MMELERVLSRIEYCIEEVEKNIERYESEYKQAPYGNYAIDLTMNINKAKGELMAYKEMKDYIKMIK